MLSVVQILAAFGVLYKIDIEIPKESAHMYPIVNLLLSVGFLYGKTGSYDSSFISSGKYSIFNIGHSLNIILYFPLCYIMVFRLFSLKFDSRLHFSISTWIIGNVLNMIKKRVREKSRECHNHKPQPFPDTERKRKQTKPNKRKSNKRTKSTRISSLFPKRGNHNAKAQAR